MSRKFLPSVYAIVASLVFVLGIFSPTIEVNNLRMLTALPDQSSVSAGAVGADAATATATADVSLRILALGTSRTDGIGAGGQLYAYPYLLAKGNSKNLAIRAAGPSYPSMCVRSMIADDEIYDVIILEFLLHLCRPKEGSRLKPLAVRLRQRFPNAIIIFIRTYPPFLYTHQGSNLGLNPYLEHNGIQSNLKELRKLASTTTKEDWVMKNMSLADSYVEEAMESVGGHDLQMPPSSDNSLEIISNSSVLFAPDLNHYSARGHEYLAQAIKHLIRDKTRSDEVNPWILADSCDQWFNTGVCHTVHSPMDMYSYGNRFSKKYGLEVKQNSSSFHVYNNMDQPARVILYYLSSGPKKVYPTTQVVLTTSKHSDPITIVPTIKKEFMHGMSHMHIVVQEEIGIVPRGRSFVTLKPIETAEQPFRVTAIAVTPTRVEEEDLAVLLKKSQYWHVHP